jgi:hypothetical protein
MEQMMECLVASIETMDSKIDASQERMMAKLDACQAKMDAWLEEMKDSRKETTNCQEAMEACRETMEVNSGDLQSLAVHQEVPKEEAAVEIIGAMKDWLGDRHLAVGHHRQLKKRTRGDGGSRQKLAAAQGRLTRHAAPAPRKGHGC